MKIAYLAAKNSIHAVRWLNAMASSGHDVHLLTLHQGGDPLDGRIRIYQMPFGPVSGYFLNAPWLIRKLMLIKPQLVHINYASGYGTLGTISGFHPRIISVWGSDVYEFPTRSRLARKLVAHTLRTADQITSTSQTMAEHTRRIFPGIRKIEIIPFGIDVDKFHPDDRPVDSGVIVVGTVKSLAPLYGIDIMIKAFSEAVRALRTRSADSGAKLRLYIAGDGPSRPELESLVQSLGLKEWTTFAGHLAHAEVPKALNRLNIFVNTSDNESFGVAILEASSCGLPVIVSDVGGLPEVVEDGKTGFIVPRGDIKATAEAIVKLATNPDLRRKMGEAGRKRVGEMFCWKENVMTMEELYRRTINSNK